MTFLCHKKDEMLTSLLPGTRFICLTNVHVGSGKDSRTQTVIYKTFQRLLVTIKESEIVQYISHWPGQMILIICYQFFMYE